MKINRVIINGINLALAGILSLLGFVGCQKNAPLDEYGSPHADYTVKGTVVNKATGKPIEGIRVGYDPINWAIAMYGVIATIFQPKSKVLETNDVKSGETYGERQHVLTDAKGEFKLTDPLFQEKNKAIPVYVQDIDGEENGLFQSDTLEVDFSKAVQTGKPDGWYEGEFTVTVNVELNEIGKETDE